MPMVSIWKKISPCHFVMQDCHHRIEIRYHASGSLSGWGVYADGTLVQQRAAFTEARGIAMGLATGS